MHLPNLHRTLHTTHFHHLHQTTQFANTNTILTSFIFYDMTAIDQSSRFQPSWHIMTHINIIRSRAKSELSTNYESYLQSYVEL